MWESPIYRFRVPVDTDSDGNSDLKEIVLDVTSSAPSFSDPGARLGGSIDAVMARVPSNAKIVDVGAGKLRNTLYILRNYPKSNVCAVEYKELLTKTGQAKSMYTTAKRYSGRFRRVVFPGEFVNLGEQFDLILLINVAQIMPVPAERLLLLRYCFQKLKANGLLFWYSQHGESDYQVGGDRCNKHTRLGDGFHIGITKLRSFFREFADYEVDQMMAASGFRFEDSVAVTRNLARIYRKKGPCLFTNQIPKADVEALRTRGEEIVTPRETKYKICKPSNKIRPILPNPECFDLENLCQKQLVEVPVGAHDATTYHRLVDLILRRVFDRELKAFAVEQEVDHGSKRIDIRARNYSQDGFFRRTDQQYHITCANIFIECKNYKNDPGNPELDQLAGRLSENKKCMIGLLVFRKLHDRQRLVAKCKNMLSDQKKYILWLEDSDLVELLKFRRAESYSSIADQMEDRLDDISL
jgi:hypothetical protein